MIELEREGLAHFDTLGEQGGELAVVAELERLFHTPGRYERFYDLFACDRHAPGRLSLPPVPPDLRPSLVRALWAHARLVTRTDGSWKEDVSLRETLHEAVALFFRLYGDTVQWPRQRSRTPDRLVLRLLFNARDKVRLLRQAEADMARCRHPGAMRLCRDRWTVAWLQARLHGDTGAAAGTWAAVLKPLRPYMMESVRLEDEGNADVDVDMDTGTEAMDEAS